MIGSQTGGNIRWDLDVDDSKFTQGLDKAKDQAKQTGDDVEKTLGSKLRGSISNAFREAQGASMAFVGGLTAVGTSMVAAAGFGIKYAADLESMRTSFITLLGSVEKADAAISQIQKDAASTPFEFKGLVRANQLLTSVTKDSLRSEKMLLNVGKALTVAGKSGAELDNVIVNLQQIANTGKISEVDIRQFGFAGINVLELLAEYYGTTKDAASDMVKNSKNAFKDLEGAFAKAGTGSGKNAKAFTDQAGNFNQIFSNLQDNLGITASKLVKTFGVFDAGKEALKKLTDAVGYFGTDAGFAKIYEGLDLIKKNLPLVAGVILGALTPAFIGLAASIGSAVIAITPFVAAGVALGLGIDYVVKKLGGWNNALKIAQDTLKSLGTVYDTYLKKPLNDLGNQIKNELLPSLMSLWTQLKPILIPALQLLGKVLGSAIVLGLQLFIQKISEFVAGLTIISNAITAFIPFAQSLPQKIGVAFNSVKTTIENAINGATQAFLNLPTDITNGISQMMRDFVVFLGFVTGLFLYGIPAAINNMIAFFSSLPTRIGEFFTQTKINISNTITAIQNWLTTNIPLIINSIVSYFATLPTRITEWLTSTKTATSTGFQDILTAIKTEVDTWPKKLFDWGVSMATSFADGITSAMGKVADAFKEGLNKAKKFVEGHSPPIAGPFKDIDKWGISVGTAWVDGVKSAISNLSLESPMMAYTPALASSGSGQQSTNNYNSGLITIQNMNVRDQNDINEISRDLAFRLEMNSGFIQNG